MTPNPIFNPFDGVAGLTEAGVPGLEDEVSVISFVGVVCLLINEGFGFFFDD
jgi:hypothetical protein